MEKKLISIIMPVYQAEKWLRDSVESVLKQSYKNYELILVDDGSTDASGQICDELEQQFEKIHTYHQRNLGVSSARNRGLELAQGDYILFLDCDDSISPDTLEILMGKMREDIDILFFNFSRCFSFGKKEDVIVNLPEGEYKGKADIQKAYMKLASVDIANNIGTKIYRKRILEDIRFDEDVSIFEDIRFCLDAVKRAGKIFFLNKHLYNYEFKNPNSLISTYKKDYYSNCRKYLNDLYVWGMENEEFKYWYAKVYMLDMRGAIKNAKIGSPYFKKEFKEICSNDKLMEIKRILKKRHFSGITLKTRVQFYMIWNKCYYGVKWLWK